LSIDQLSDSLISEIFDGEMASCIFCFRELFILSALIITLKFLFVHFRIGLKLQFSISNPLFALMVQQSLFQIVHLSISINSTSGSNENKSAKLLVQIFENFIFAIEKSSLEAVIENLPISTSHHASMYL
jgi:hypothetical protein